MKKGDKFIAIRDSIEWSGFIIKAGTIVEYKREHMDGNTGFVVIDNPTNPTKDLLSKNNLFRDFKPYIEMEKQLVPYSKESFGKWYSTQYFKVDSTNSPKNCIVYKVIQDVEHFCYLETPSIDKVAEIPKKEITFIEVLTTYAGRIVETNDVGNIGVQYRYFNNEFQLLNDTFGWNRLGKTFNELNSRRWFLVP